MTSPSIYSPRRGEPEPLRPFERRQLDVALNGLHGPEEAYIIAESLPEPVRDFLKRRRSELWLAFKPATKDDLEDLLAPFLGAYVAAGRLSDLELGLYLANARAAFTEFPRWILEHAVQRFRRAVVGNPAFVPTVPELAAEATVLLEPWLNEARQVDRVLKAERVLERKPPGADEAARIDEAVARFKMDAAVSRPRNEEERSTVHRSETPAETLARLSGRDLAEVEAELADLPDSPNPPRPVRPRTETEMKVAADIAKATDAHIARGLAATGAKDVFALPRYAPRPLVGKRLDLGKATAGEWAETPPRPGWDSRFTRADGTPLGGHAAGALSDPAQPG